MSLPTAGPTKAVDLPNGATPSLHNAPPKNEVAVKSCGGRYRIQALIDRPDGGAALIGQVITVCGWSRTVRKQGGGKYCFVALNDGSTATNLQVVVGDEIAGFDKLLKAGVGWSFRYVGEVVSSPADGQAVELAVRDPQLHELTIYGETDQGAYPLSKKQHSKEFLRGIAHLRPRTYLIGAVSRLRSQMAMAVHNFFQQRGFQYVHTPIITASDCEGAGEMFQVTTLLKEKLHDIPSVNVTPKGAEPGTPAVRNVNYKKEFFSKPAFLTVSGQLAVENFCCGLSDVYTFGPTFRAENSHTSRHLAEFWMIEPEMAFADIKDNMACAEDLLKYCVSWALTNSRKDLEWLNSNVDKELIERLENIIQAPFARITYTEAIEILEKSGETFEAKPEWGLDMGAEHERYLTEKVYKKPVIVYNYPKAFKAFYMRQNEDGKTVAAMDVLLPKLGELMGGSQREERLPLLDKMIEEKGLEIEPYWWYRELRKYGTIPHSGFGLGFERLIMLVTGVDNIRDVIPFPRYPGHAEF